MKQMSLIEMDGFLKGKCLPRDLKVNETNAEYLVRKFAEAEAKCAALAAENAGLKSGDMDEINVINRGGQAYCVKDGVQVNPMYARGWNDYRAKSLQSDTPATDAFLAEIERKAIRKFINSIEHILRDKLSPYDTEEMTITKQRVEEIISRIEMYGHGAGYTVDEVYDLAVLALNLSNIANLKRYELDMGGCDSRGQDCGAVMTEDSDGDYVLFDDLVKLFEFDTTTQKLESPAKEAASEQD